MFLSFPFKRLAKNFAYFCHDFMKRFLTIILICMPAMLMAQTGSLTSDTLSWLSSSPKLSYAVARMKETNAGRQSMSGYRIQIYFGSQRSKANELRALFNSRFPDITAVVSYQQPNFKVRAGDFRTRMEAQCKMEIIEKEFPGAFVVPDEIRLPPLK